MNCHKHGYYLNINGCPKCSFDRNVLRQNVLSVVSATPALAAEVDAEWVDDKSKTVGERMGRMNVLCATVLRRHGYKVRE